ncbi:hypothetical protein LTR56_010008 [Elasticomyces elasticus]|nr:hypothetical protein LTR56_010008 [Elasticomyces elasticus]
MSPNGGDSKQSARSPSPAGSDISDVIVFTGRLNRASQPLARSKDHLLAPEDPASSNTSSVPRSAPLPDHKHADVTEGCIAPRQAQRRENDLAAECHELESGQHSKPQLAPSALENPPSHEKGVDADAEVVVAVHRCDATSTTYIPNYGPRYDLGDAGNQPTTPGCVATSPRYKPSHVSKYDMVDDEYRLTTPEYLGTSPRRYSGAPTYIPMTPKYSLTSSLNPTTSEASTSSPNASHEEIVDNDEIEAARQEEAEKLEKYEVAINSFAKRERELQEASEACDRALHQYLKHGLHEEECERTHAEWARLRENYEKEVMWPSRVLYEQISDGVKKTMFEGMDLGDPHFVFPSMTTMLRGQLEQRVKEGAARATEASTSHALREPFDSTEPDTLEAATQSTSSVAENTMKCSLSPQGHDGGLGVPETKVRAKDGKQHASMLTCDQPNGLTRSPKAPPISSR